jgi:DNA-binding CsgD family transcriptional regulator
MVDKKERKPYDIEAFFRRPVAQPILSTREIEVVKMVAEGWDNQTIANKLFIGIKTVEHHIFSIFIKMRDEFDCTGRNPRVYLSVIYREWIKQKGGDVKQGDVM